MNVREDPFEGVDTSDPPKERPADAPTQKQIEFIKSLHAEKRPGEDLVMPGTRREASRFIDELMSETKKESQPPEGIHQIGGQIVKVQTAHHGTGKRYMKVLDVEDRSWAYLGRAQPLFGRLSEDTLMSLEEAQSFGRLYGFCVRCGAILTDEHSIERGIGPICAEAF